MLGAVKGFRDFVEATSKETNKHGFHVVPLAFDPVLSEKRRSFGVHAFCLALADDAPW